MTPVGSTPGGAERSEQHEEMRFPKQALWGAVAVVCLAFGGAVAVRMGVLPQVADPQAMRAQSQAKVVESRDLVFLDQNGAVLVRDTSGKLVATIDAGSEQGFVRGVMRGLARERRLKDAPMSTPFRLQLWSDNGLTLTDLATNRQIELGGFGPTNREAFAIMLSGKDKG